jgi:hypothetical protein
MEAILSAYLNRGSPQRGHSPRLNSPVRRTEDLLSAYLTEVLHYEDTVQDGTVLSGARNPFVRLPDRGSPLPGHCPRRNSPVWSTESLLSAYLTEVLHYEDAVRDGTVLSGEWDSGPVQVRRTEGHVGRAVVVNQLDCDLKKENLLETDVYLSET